MRSVSFVLIVLFLVVLDPPVVQSGCGTMRWEEDSFGLRTTASMIKYLNELHAPAASGLLYCVRTHTCTYKMRLREYLAESQIAERGGRRHKHELVVLISPDFERPINSTRDRRTEEHDEGG